MTLLATYRSKRSTKSFHQHSAQQWCFGWVCHGWWDTKLNCNSCSAPCMIVKLGILAGFHFGSLCCPFCCSSVVSAGLIRLCCSFYNLLCGAAGTLHWHPRGWLHVSDTCMWGSNLHPPKPLKCLLDLKRWKNPK